MHWLVQSEKALDRHQAVVIGQALMDAKYLFRVTEPPSASFDDDLAIYRLRERTTAELTYKQEAERGPSLSEHLENEPNWVQELENPDYHGQSWGLPGEL